MRTLFRSALAVAALTGSWLVFESPPAAQPLDAPTLRIIVATSEEQARQLLDRVRKGEDFAAVGRADSIGRAMEVRLQRDQVDRQDSFRRQTTENNLDEASAK